MKATNLPVRKTKCATCPFLVGSKYAYLVANLSAASMQESRICHSTGTSAIMGRTGLPSFICRGSRDTQLHVMHALGVIAAPTDEAWNKQRASCGMKPQEVRNPKRRKR